MDILLYDDNKHRNDLISLWKSVFNYHDKRNDPALSIDNKLKINDNLLFIAIKDNKLIGSIMGGYDGHRGWIYSLSVDNNHRKKGVGSTLLKYLENELKKRGCIKINLQILVSNEGVVEFYNKNGYKIEERISMGKEILENIQK